MSPALGRSGGPSSVSYSIMAVPTDLPSELAAPTGRRFTMALAVVLALWAALVGGFAYLLYSRTYWLREADEANLREWLDEYRNFRKSLPDLVREYVARRGQGGLPAGDPVRTTMQDRPTTRLGPSTSAKP